MPVDIELKDRIMVVTINRPEVSNAVDRPTAKALADAFRDFDAMSTARVAVLCGAGGNFCAGADLKAMGGPVRQNRAEEDGDGPMGPSRMLLSKPVIAAVSGYAVAGSSWRRGATCGWSRRARCSGCSAGGGACPLLTAARSGCRA